MDDRGIMMEVIRLIDEGVSVKLPVSGKSMRPFIVGGRDSVILQKPVNLKVGEIVLAKVEGSRYVLHRIVRFDGVMFTLMGDGNILGTEHCAICDIKGVATHVVRGDGKEINLKCVGSRLTWTLWRWLCPVRKYLLMIYNKV